MRKALHKPVKESERHATSDGAAAVLSSLCLVHCLLLPLLLALAPMVAIGVPGSSLALYDGAGVHWVLLATALPVSAYALWRGGLCHGSFQPFCWAILGFALVALGALAHGAGSIEQWATVAGGLVVAGAHWKNWTLAR